MFDTHCHLNFKIFKKNYSEVITAAKRSGVNYIVIPGTDLETSVRAVEIAEQNTGIYAAVGIHPHHVFQIQNSKLEVQNYKSELKNIEKLLTNPKIVAVGEVGLDRHVYKKTKYEDYQVDEAFIELQKELFIAQLKLAIKYKKSVIIHNREAKKDLLSILTNNPSLITSTKIVFHCCEPDDELLQFAKKHNVFIGVDGDVTYWKEKQKFIKKIPLELMVLETDSPLLLPEPLRSQKLYPNEPKNIYLIAEFIAKLKNMTIGQLIEETANNSMKLFGLEENKG